MRSKAMTISLLSISLVLTSPGAVAGTIPAIQNSFPNQSLPSIEMLITVPSFAIIFSVLMSSKLAQLIGAKRTVVLGLNMALIGGIAPTFINNYALFLGARLLFGFGLGTFNSLAVSLIGTFFESPQKEKLIGLQSSCQGLGSAMLTYLCGVLLMLSWRASFLVYLIMIPIMILFIRFVPDPRQAQSKPTNKVFDWQIFKNKRYLFGLALMFILLSVYCIPQIKISQIVIERGYGNGTTASTLLSFMQISSMIFGGLFGWLRHRLKDSLFPLSIVVFILGFLCIYEAQTMTLSAVGVIFIGAAFALFIPFLYNLVTEVLPSDFVNIGLSILLVAANLGSFATPYLLFGVGKVFSLSGASYTFLFGLMILVAILVVVLVSAHQKSRTSGDITQ
ncbi:MFS transporter [Secundilactobacillus yichangensis]|uniref:MFS transporter n=1 Tax=Secundilactobacillus yichangensis TaxID=2799580 RepID=UPI001942B99E|nr:MFS transporter [Secundilactobacillus yichangensis]